MVEIIDDTGFECLASGIGGIIVPENVRIIECCQDPDNISIVYFVCSLSGIYLYTPQVIAKTESTEVNISNTFIPNYKNIGVSEFPISTNFGTISITIAYDIGSLIPDFGTVPRIEFRLIFNGDNSNVGPEIIEVPMFFSSVNPSASVVLNKGITPRPYRLFFDELTGQLKIQYSNVSTTECLCAINCVNASMDDFSISLCEDEVQEVSLPISNLFEDPIDLSFVFRDAIGNESIFNVYAVLRVTPAAPILKLQSHPLYVTINPTYATSNKTAVNSDKVLYQILRYENSPDNVSILKDWTTPIWKTIYDRNIRSGRKYGYAIRFMGEFKDISNLSSWAEIEV